MTLLPGVFQTSTSRQAANDIFCLCRRPPAGLVAVGDAIDDRNRSRSDSYGQCEAYLDDYMRSVTAEAGSVQYVQPGQYMLVPVTVSVPQRVIYRERTSGN